MATSIPTFPTISSRNIVLRLLDGAPARRSLTTLTLMRNALANLEQALMESIAAASNSTEAVKKLLCEVHVILAWVRFFLS
jgi:hypothetical protein